MKTDYQQCITKDKIISLKHTKKVQKKVNIRTLKLPGPF